MKLNVTRLVGVATGALVVLGLAVPATATGRPADAGCANPLLSSSTRAADVADHDPAAFSSAARRNGRDPKAFAATARGDRTLWLDRCGQAYYVDPARDTTASAGATGPSAAGAATSTVPLADTFTLQSRPGAQRTIYLDFLGDTVTGTAWNNTYGSTITAEPYSADATGDTNFTDAELTQIQKAWQVVAEDYAPFDVNVTLKDLGPDAIDRSSSTDQVYGTRVLITTDDTIYNSCGCGGIAYVNVFNLSGTNHAYYQPAWVLTKGVGSGGKNIGEAAAHEVGHNFGLSHDGTSTQGYYAGSTPWAPIMGVGYYQPVSQWSAGEYPDANNTQDDLAIIATGAPLRTDDYGDQTNPAPLVSGTALNGVISTRTDTDAFRFTGAGATTLSVTPADFADLDVSLTILDSSGAVVTTVNPAVAATSSSTATGLDATWTATLPDSGGTYTAVVDGTGTGDPLVAGNYSDYASLGNYQIALSTGTPVVPNPLTLSSADPAAGTVGQPYAATPVTATGGVTPYAFSAAGLPGGLSIDQATGTISGTPTVAGTFPVTVTVNDAAADTDNRTVSLVVNPAAVPPTTVAAQSFTGSVGVAQSNQLVAGGGDGTYTWAVSAGSLPPGLALSTAGVLSGTPTAAGTFSFSAQATSAGTSAANTITVTIAAPPLAFVTGTSLPRGKVSTAYSAAITVTGGTPGYTWTRTKGSIPAGTTLTFSGGTATLAGTPTKAAKYSFTLKATDSKGVSVTRTFSVTIGK